MIFLYIFIFLASCLIMTFSGKLLLDGLVKVAKFLALREFIVAFFLMAFATSLPNLFVGLSSAFHKIPELSFGDVVGGDVVDMTIVIGLSVLAARAGNISAESRMVQASSVFTIIAAILPLILVLDGALSRGDGLILLLVFAAYSAWLFSKKERYQKIYDSHKEESAIKETKNFLKNIIKLLFGFFCLILAAEGIVGSSLFMSREFNLPLPMIGILIVGLGNSLPEAYFTIISSRAGQTWMTLGNLMGSVIVPTTLVLGTVALIRPIEIPDFSPFAIARLFLIISSFFFFLFLRTGRKIAKKEAGFLLLIYLVFVVVEILVK